MKTSTPFIACVLVASTAALSAADIREEYATHNRRSGSDDGLSRHFDFDARLDFSLNGSESSHGNSARSFEADDVFIGMDESQNSSSRIFGEILADDPENMPVVLGRRGSHPRGDSFEPIHIMGTPDNQRHGRWTKDFDLDHAEVSRPSSRFIPAPGGIPLAGFGLLLAASRRARRSRA